MSWKASLQRVVALSTTKAEYAAATEGFKEALWLKGMLEEMKMVDSNNQSALFLMKNPAYHERTKLVDVKMHFVKDIITKGEACVIKVASEENPADALTKNLPTAKLQYFLKLIGMIAVEPLKRTSLCNF